MYVDFHHNSGWGMYIDRILKSRNPQNSNLVRKNRENNYFSSRTKLEVLRYIHFNWCRKQTYQIATTIEELLR